MILVNTKLRPDSHFFNTNNFQTCSKFDKAIKNALKENQERKDIELVIEMYKDGLENERIVKITKLNMDKVKEIIENHKKDA